MSDSNPDDWPTDPEDSTGKSPGDLALDGFVNAATLLSLVTVVAGFLTEGTVWWVVGLLVGVPGMVLPWLAAGRKWSVPTRWATVVAVIAADAVAMTLMWTVA